MHLPTPNADSRIPAESIGSITPSQVLADARAAGARPEHVLDAATVAIASVMESVAGIDFHHLLPGLANDVQNWAHGWLHLHHGFNPRFDLIPYTHLGDDIVTEMLDHVAEHVRHYDCYAG